ncbi:MAG: NAD(P)-dependent alcohol dehydrogenase [Arenicella sp.]
MKAVVRSEYGSPNVLSIQDITAPRPNDNEVLVRIYATTVNRTDCGILSGKPFLIRFFTGLLKPKHHTPGTDFAGRIEAVGKHVDQFKVGDDVWGLDDEGLSSHAEYMVIEHHKGITHMPTGFSYQQAVACAEGAHYAFNFINKVTVNRGDKVLVNGATGAIGSAALQLLKSKGAIVTAVGNTPNLALLESLGADKVVDYLQEDFLNDADKYHFVFDAVGKSSFSACKKIMEQKAVYISSELGPHHQNLYLPLVTKFLGKQKVIFPIPFNCRRSIEFMTALAEKGQFKAVIDREYPMDDIKAAYDYVASGQKTGNVVINCST